MAQSGFGGFVVKDRSCSGSWWFIPACVLPPTREQVTEDISWALRMGSREMKGSTESWSCHGQALPTLQFCLRMPRWKTGDGDTRKKKGWRR